MASNYELIRADNQQEYGRGIARWGRDVLAIRYDDRTHFIFELLQNAEDALKRRPADWQGPRAVSFCFDADALRISHYGEAFDERDVRGICGIAESTKEDLTAIGRFGIGFKSVYAITDRPEVHSGTEDFAIENFVWPTAVSPVQRAIDETVIILPVRGDVDRQAITKGLKQIGARTLLFLRQIDAIEWRVEDGPSGVYLRSTPESLGNGTCRIALIGLEQDQAEIEENWLVFSRPVSANGTAVGHVELAFSVPRADDGDRIAIEPVADSRLVAYFPTVLPTNLGFLLQGPYRTTPGRDNVPRDDPWNQHLACETSAVLVEALRWFRDHKLLDPAVLRCLPLDRTRFSEANMFAPLFEATRQALQSEPLLPESDGGYVAARNAQLARTQDLRELISSEQLSLLFDHDGDLAWLRGDITQDRTPELRRYLIQELGIVEVTPETIVPKLEKGFLEDQDDDWILQLYEFLAGQPALLRQRRLSDVPLVRLHDGTQVQAVLNGQPQAFLPGAVETDFPTVRRSVCATAEARSFLQALGLTEPDTINDIIWNVLPKYQAKSVSLSTPDYETDIRRILAAFETDSKEKRDKLIAALRGTAFVMVIDAGNGSKWRSKPGGTYIATERLKDLFSGVGGVFLVDDAYACLRGEDVRNLLEACGATRYLRPVSKTPDFTWEQLREMRIAAGCESMSSAEPPEDHSLYGLDGLLKLLPELDESARGARAELLWEALADLEDRRSTGIFSGSYRWHYYYRRNTTFDAAFVRQLNHSAWVPDAKGELQSPRFVPFSALSWKPNPFLETKIRFKPPIIETLAREAGFEPGALDLLQKLGITSEADLRDRLGLKDEPLKAGDGSPDNVQEALKELLGDIPLTTPPVPDPAGAEPSGSGARAGAESGVGPSNAAAVSRSAGGGVSSGSGVSHGDGHPGVAGGPGTGDGNGAGASEAGKDGEPATGAAHSAESQTSGSVNSRPFISYIAAHPDANEADPDGLDQSARMALEERAIVLVLATEPGLHRTPTHNRGFDLFQPSDEGKPARWVEVKAITGIWHNRPVGLSRAQFECAQERREAYWLYVVEHAGNVGSRIVRIQDPAGKARTFTFDHGWLAVADYGSVNGKS
jgi:hypothetical protein